MEHVSGVKGVPFLRVPLRLVSEDRRREAIKEPEVGVIGARLGRSLTLPLLLCTGMHLRRTST